MTDYMAEAAWIAKVAGAAGRFDYLKEVALSYAFPIKGARMCDLMSAD
jgi:protease II